MVDYVISLVFVSPGCAPRFVFTHVQICRLSSAILFVVVVVFPQKHNKDYTVFK